MKKARRNRAISFFVALGMAGIINFSSHLSFGESSLQDFLRKEHLKEPVALELSLEDVIKLALRNCLDIQIAKFDAYIARTSLQEAESIFDTVFTAQASYSRDKKEQTTTLIGTDTKEQKISLGLEKKLPSATTLSLDATTTKTRTDSPFAALNPYNEASLEFTITQQLGKNFFGLTDRSNIKITKIDIENSEFLSLDSIEKALYDTQKSYWNLVLQQEKLAIAKDMLGEAEKLYEIYQEKRNLGLVEESEFLAIKALVKTRQSDVAIARLERETAKNNLLFLLNKGDFKQDIIAKDSLNCEVNSLDLYKALKKAVNNRRDYKRIKNELKKNKIDIVIKENALWPQIDLEATFSRNNLDSQRGRAWQDLVSESNEEVLFKISFKLPLEKREARSALRRANLQKSQFLLKFKRLERLILQEINDRVNQVNTVQNQVKLFREIVKIHTKKLKEQIKRLSGGRSDFDTVIRYEEDLLQARLSLAEYLFRYRVSLIELELAQNTLLDKYWSNPL